MTHAKKYTTLLKLILFLALVFGLALTAKAQDFYGEGNVLIAVDMGPYAENVEIGAAAARCGDRALRCRGLRRAEVVAPYTVHTFPAPSFDRFCAGARVE